MLSGQNLPQERKIIKNDGFWPDIDLDEFLTQRSMPPNINAELLTQALVSAIVDINMSLSTYKLAQKAKGIDSAQQIGVVSVDGLSSTLFIYQKALFARAKADLIGEFVSTSNRQDPLGDNQLQMAKALLAESSREIRKILGLKRVTVALL